MSHRLHLYCLHAVTTSSHDHYLCIFNQQTVDAGVTLHSIAITDDADSNMDAIAIVTGGIPFLYDVSDQSNALNEAFQTIGELTASGYHYRASPFSQIHLLYFCLPWEFPILDNSEVSHGGDFKFWNKLISLRTKSDCFKEVMFAGHLFKATVTRRQGNYFFLAWFKSSLLN